MALPNHLRQPVGPGWALVGDPALGLKRWKLPDLEEVMVGDIVFAIHNADEDDVAGAQLSRQVGKDLLRGDDGPSQDLVKGHVAIQEGDQASGQGALHRPHRQ